LVVFALPTPFNPNNLEPAGDDASAVVALEQTATMVTPSETPIPPTVTPIPPTVTPIPPTATPIPPTATLEPTVAPTEVPTEEAVASAEDPIAAAIALGNPAEGATTFNLLFTTSSGGWMCMSCHSVDEAQTRLVGPGLYGIYNRVERLEASGEPDMATYVRNSIINPAGFHAPADPAYPENLMPQNYGEVFTEQQLNDLVAYLLTLGNPDA
jgi:mono/diheme cytochrome c family protein